MMTLKCSDLFNKKAFSTYSEFLFSLCIAQELGRRGMCLDMRDMSVNPEMVTDTYKHYLRFLAQEGYILTNEKPKEHITKPGICVDTGLFALLESKGILFSSEPVTNTELWVSTAFAKEHWWKDALPLLNLGDKGYILLHLVAYWFLRRVIDKDERKLTIIINNQESVSTYIYVNLCSILHTLKPVRFCFDLDVDTGDAKVDIDYSLFCNNGFVMKHYNYWTVAEKKNWMKQLGMVPGSIVILWSRSKLSTSNKWGRLDSSILARIDEIGSDYIAVATIAVNKTKEEVRNDYYSIDEAHRYLFVDLLDKKPYVRNEILNLCDLGIGDYFQSELRFITPIDTSEDAVVRKTITVEGVTKETELTEVNALYWLLCQYDIDFNRELYRKMYNHGKPLYWDELSDE